MTAMKRLLEEAKKMIRFNSVTANGNEELANYACLLLQDNGFKANLQQVTHSVDEFSKRQFNVIGILGDPLVDKKIRKGLLLTTHLDTVTPGLPESWVETAGDPFSATVKDGKIFGLGSAEAKLDFLCKLHAAAKYREKKLRMPLYLVGSCGEEAGMFGARYLIKAGTLNPKYVLVGGPTELRTVYAHKSHLIFKVSIGYQQIERDARGFNRRIDLHSFGKSAHAAYPHYGLNAIQESTAFLQKAGDNGFELRFTKFDGGDTTNKVPDRALMQFYLTSHQFEDFKRFFREVVRAEGKERSFRVELGGVGDTGVRFLPEALFPCLNGISDFFSSISADFSKVKDETYDPPHSTINFGRLRQGLSSLVLEFDARLLPDLVLDEIEKHVQKGVQKIAAGYPSLNITVSRDRINPGLAMTPEHELIRLCRDTMEDSGIEPVLGKKSTATEAAQYFQAGYEAAVFGPGASLGNSHSPNEHNLLDHLEKATAFYDRLIERVCQ
jgi:acetylornithine deacetylase/succinyl-diaminopimelate desuccinylase-like protein